MCSFAGGCALCGDGAAPLALPVLEDYLYFSTKQFLLPPLLPLSFPSSLLPPSTTPPLNIFTRLFFLCPFPFPLVFLSDGAGG